MGDGTPASPPQSFAVYVASLTGSPVDSSSVLSTVPRTDARFSRVPWASGAQDSPYLLAQALENLFKVSSRGGGGELPRPIRPDKAVAGATGEEAANAGWLPESP